MSTTVVIGATGKVGREVVAQLLAKGEQVRAATRNPGAAELPKGASAVQVSLERQETLRKALAGADRLFAVLGRPPITFERHAQEFADCWRG
jgi:uncharacterized protein YbjT (DUF2867 family)